MEKNQHHDQVISRARAAFKSGNTLPLLFRLQQLQSFRKMIDESTDDFLRAMHVDLRKSKTEGLLFEIEGLQSEVSFFIRHLENLMKDERAILYQLTYNDHAMIKHDPYGVVLVMGAWNYPILLTLQPVVGAIAAGNCVIIKPCENAPACSTVIAKVISKFLDPQCYHVIEADIEGTKLLLKNQFDYIFATGSVRMGKVIMAAAAPFLTPVTLELGGKNPCVITKNVDMQLAVKRILWGKLINLGQTSVAPDYILCSKEVQKDFVSIAAVVIKEWYGANPQESADLPRIINDSNFMRLKNILDTTKADIAIGGNTDRGDKWIEPTILTNVTADDSVMDDEIFGPILPVVNVRHLEEAIQFINARPKPLALYIFTQDDSFIKSFLERTSSGGVCINDTIWHVATKGPPLGGVGNSGMGRYRGKLSWETFSHQKAVVHRKFNRVEEKLRSGRYPPNTKTLTTIMQDLYQLESK